MPGSRVEIRKPLDVVVRDWSGHDRRWLDPRPNGSQESCRPWRPFGVLPARAVELSRRATSRRSIAVRLDMGPGQDSTRAAWRPGASASRLASAVAPGEWRASPRSGSDYLTLVVATVQQPRLDSASTLRRVVHNEGDQHRNHDRPWELTRIPFDIVCTSSDKAKGRAQRRARHSQEEPQQQSSQFPEGPRHSGTPKWARSKNSSSSRSCSSSP